MTSRTVKGKAAGFTLLEIIIVLVVLGLVGALVIQRGPLRSQTLDVRAASARVVQVLRGARGAAIAAGQPVVVAVDMQRQRLVAEGRPSYSFPPGFSVFVLAGVPLRPGGPPGGIRFMPDGSSSGGRLALGEGARRVVVGVDWLTGRVTLADAR